jgi:CHAD domain-containing protein
MAYRFESGEEIADGVRRICDEQIAAAMSALTDEDLGSHEGVHEARKCFKKIRGVLRLARPAMGELYAQENAWFRDRGREMSGVRDATALVETVDSLGDTFDEQFDSDFMARVRDSLLQRRERLAHQQGDLQGQLDDLVESLGEARRRVPGWGLSIDGFDALGPGLARTYGRGRKALAQTHEHPTPAAFHELRKRAKYHRYHADLLRLLWRPVLDPYRDELHRLTDLLGHNQDLDVLRTTLLAEPDVVASEGDRTVLLGLVAQREREVRGGAQALGAMVFAERPKCVAARFGGWWQAWQE